MKETEMRDLDAWICCYVMGRRVVNCSGEAKVVAGKSQCFKNEDGTPADLVEDIPHYSTDPAAAMQVLEKCAKKTEQLGCLYFGMVGKDFILGHEEIGESVDKTLPLAIAQFARNLFEK